MKSLCFSMGGPIRKLEFSSTSNAILQVASVEETQDIQRQFNCYRNILLPLDASLSALFATTVQIIQLSISYSISYGLCAESHRRHLWCGSSLYFRPIYGRKFKTCNVEQVSYHVATAKSVWEGCREVPQFNWGGWWRLELPVNSIFSLKNFYNSILACL